MKNLPLRIVVLFAVAAVFAPLLALAAEPTDGQEARELDRTIRVQMKYLLYLPKDYDQKDAWSEAYNTPELYEWLLQQKRTERMPRRR